MSNYFSIFLGFICLFVSFFITFIYRKWALNRSILDLPNERSSHQIPTPRGGGISIVIIFYSLLVFLFLTKRIEELLFFALLPGLLLSVIGLIDDLRGIGTYTKLLVQIISAGIALFFLGGLKSLIGRDLLLIWTIISLFGIVWHINLFNFMDGSDGYASMEAISVLLSLYALTRSSILLYLFFIICGFLYWNWPKAKIFMGDVGSTTLGFILVILGINFHNNGTLHLSFWILITALFWFDATVTLIFRIEAKEKLTRAHKNHIYQRAIQGGLTHLQTLISGLIINIILFLICFLIWKSYIPYVVGFSVSILILWITMIYVNKKYPFNSV
ncbi:MAG: glycosyltransferase family 4 protein [Bacteroidales bacterium]|nr:glycosyltransferase family 4 protein [Bacteroidales bacterium]